jgi:hypothetical protein
VGQRHSLDEHGLDVSARVREIINMNHTTCDPSLW